MPDDFRTLMIARCSGWRRRTLGGFLHILLVLAIASS